LSPGDLIASISPPHFVKTRRSSGQILLRRFLAFGQRAGILEGFLPLGILRPAKTAFVLPAEEDFK